MDDKKYYINEYPRPQFVREDWLNLNGLWNFAFDDENIGEEQKWFTKKDFAKKINVPFVYECEASLIKDTLLHENVWYQRSVTIPERFHDKNIILNFQGADYITKLWVNGTFIGVHFGGNTSFSFDITNYIDVSAENNMVVKIEDSNDCTQPRGKQRWIDDNFGCWYVQTTGIWKSVWMEFLNSTNLESVKITPDVDNSSVKMEFHVNEIKQSHNLSVKAVITYDNKPITEYTLGINRQSMDCNIKILSNAFEFKLMLWDVSSPNLYNVKFTLYEDTKIIDRVDSYFGMRKISIANGKIYLNNHQIYQKLILDQGYWAESLLTPPSEEAIIKDIDMIISMGFNGLRKHQKIEDERFLYWCDKKGLLVWSEMAATYEFSDEAISKFTHEWIDIVKQQYNHPSIITWTPFNESWGVSNIRSNRDEQHFTESIYHLTKAMDSMRPVIVNDGWEHTISDIITIHDYEELGEIFSDKYSDKSKIVNEEILSSSNKNVFADGYSYKGQPIIISEYGGIAFKSEEGWGYGNQVKNEDEFLARYSSITKAIMDQKYIVGFCYTQITDVQQEINGLLTENRIPKIDLNKIKEINNMR